MENNLPAAKGLPFPQPDPPNPSPTASSVAMPSVAMPLAERPPDAMPSGAGPFAAGPFVKWAGGKRSLLPQLTQYLPENIRTYWEPFAGGGALFFALADRINQAVLSDSNEELVITYAVVKEQVEQLIEALREHEQKHQNDKYYSRVRKHEPTEGIEIAARFIYLNKTCYNGLYRVNKSGKFNVPKGSYKNPSICQADQLRAASTALAKANIRLGDFAKVVAPKADDFVYCDPPYDECFADYQADGFTEDDQKHLRNTIRAWAAQGAKVMLSNSDTALIRRLYQQKQGAGEDQFTIYNTAAPRPINSRGSERGAVPEFIITTYG